MKTFAGMALMGAILAGCDSATTPLAPSPPQAAPQPNPNPSQIQLTGYVADSAFRSLAGARVEVVNGPQAGLSGTTGANGQFEMFGAFDDTTRVRASKEGHVDATGALNPSCGSCPTTRRWISLYLATLAPPVNLTGDYTLTFVADGACPDLPDEVRTRVYTAAIRPDAHGRGPEGTRFEATFIGADFAPEWDRLPIGVAGDFVTFAFWGEPLWLVEHVATRTTLGFGGRAEVTVDPGGFSRISTTFEGVIDYCVLASDTGRFLECAPADTHVVCESESHRLTLERR
jgi:hypothetical protein